MENWTTDRLLETLAWIKDRRGYCRACNRPAPYQDIKAESDIYIELERRGFYENK